MFQKDWLKSWACTLPVQSLHLTYIWHKTDKNVNHAAQLKAGFHQEQADLNSNMWSMGDTTESQNVQRIWVLKKKTFNSDFKLKFNSHFSYHFFFFHPGHSRQMHEISQDFMRLSLYGARHLAGDQLKNHTKW